MIKRLRFSPLAAVSFIQRPAASPLTLAVSLSAGLTVWACGGDETTEPGQTPPVGTQLTFTVQPSDALHGRLITPPVEVTIQDALGNVVAGATDAITVALGTNPGGGTPREATPGAPDA